MTRVTSWLKAAAVAFLLLIIAGIWLSIYSDLLWFKELGYSSVYWTTFWAKILTFLVFSIVFFFMAWTNVRAAYRLSPKPEEIGYFRELNVLELVMRSRFEKVGWAVGLAVLSMIVGGIAATKWDLTLRFLNGVPFGTSEPIFERDAGFYVFTLPFLKFVQRWFLNSLIFALVITTIVYAQEKAIMVIPTQVRMSRATRSHLSFIAGLILLLITLGVRLRMYDLLYSTRGVVRGVGYTDHRAQILAYWIVACVALVSSALMFVNVKRRSWRLPAFAVAALISAAIVVGAIYPAIVQQLVVRPNEITKERPYIRNSVKATRAAFGLTKVEAVPFEVSGVLTYNDVQKNVETISNIKLWDPRPLAQTYKQIQEIRLYYDFMSVDEDRYIVGGKHTQVMLSARELAVSQLPEQAHTWVNMHLKYTHGYGACMSPVSNVTTEGLPVLLIKDIPPEAYPGLEIKRPEIYFGEETEDYCIAGTREQEFDYPMGEQNVYASYRGTGGIPIGNGLRKLAYAWRFKDIRILLTRYIDSDSRILFRRLIGERARVVAPFMAYDRDPYMVIAGGRLFWIIDTYTTTNLYPYSERIHGRDAELNYIRNSVKLVIDAYNGSMTYYVIDESDPLVKTNMKIFPRLFRRFDEMPPEVKSHLRYPRDLFRVQVQVYCKYHMEDPQVFYNQEDLWALPHQMYEGSEILMMPYYVSMKLPESDKAEFRLMVPVTPSSKSNMIAWISAMCDFPDYGRFIVYQLPKKNLVYGPMQIEARVDQDPDISREMTLWGQKGSRVMRGDLLVIPIEKSILYAQPVYLQATTGQLPELKRVIIAHGDRIVMEPTMNMALSRVFGETPAAEQELTETRQVDVKALAGDAMEIFRKAKKSLSQWEWEEFGREMDRLEEVLKQMGESSKNR